MKRNPIGMSPLDELWRREKTIAAIWMRVKLEDQFLSASQRSGIDCHGEVIGRRRGRRAYEEPIGDRLNSIWLVRGRLLLLATATLLLVVSLLLHGWIWNRREFDRQRETRKENMLKQNWEKKNKRKKTVASDRPVRLDRNPYLFWVKWLKFNFWQKLQW